MTTVIVKHVTTIPLLSTRGEHVTTDVNSERVLYCNVRNSNTSDLNTSTQRSVDDYSWGRYMHTHVGQKES